MQVISYYLLTLSCSSQYRLHSAVPGMSSVRRPSQYRLHSAVPGMSSVRRPSQYRLHSAVPGMSCDLPRPFLLPPHFKKKKKLIFFNYNFFLMSASHVLIVSHEKILKNCNVYIDRVVKRRLYGNQCAAYST